MKIDSWRKAVRNALTERAADPSVLIALEGGRYGRPASAVETRH